MATTTATYRVLGTTDEVTTCQDCGRDELKGTIVLGILDVDGNIEDRVYFGAVCGARAAGKPVKELRDEARRADNERFAEARRADNERFAEVRRARRAAREAEEAEYLEWVLAKYGRNACRKTGKSIHDLRAEFRADTAAADVDDAVIPTVVLAIPLDDVADLPRLAALITADTRRQRQQPQPPQPEETVMDEHICDSGPTVREPIPGEDRYVQERRYCRVCGEMTSSQTVRA